MPRDNKIFRNAWKHICPSSVDHNTSEIKFHTSVNILTAQLYISLKNKTAFSGNGSKQITAKVASGYRGQDRKNEFSLWQGRFTSDIRKYFLDKKSKAQELPEDAVTPLYCRSLKSGQRHIYNECRWYVRFCLGHVEVLGNLLSAQCCHHLC